MKIQLVAEVSLSDHLDLQISVTLRIYPKLWKEEKNKACTKIGGIFFTGSYYLNYHKKIQSIVTSYITTVHSEDKLFLHDQKHHQMLNRDTSIECFNMFWLGLLYSDKQKWLQHYTLIILNTFLLFYCMCSSSGTLLCCLSWVGRAATVK